MDDLADESRPIALLSGLETLTDGLSRPAAQITSTARDILRQLKTVDLGRALNADLQYRVEQWEGEDIAACRCRRDRSMENRQGARP